MKCLKCGTDKNIPTIDGHYANKMQIPVEHDKGSSFYLDDDGDERHFDRIRIEFSKTLILCKACRADILIEKFKRYKRRDRVEIHSDMTPEMRQELMDQIEEKYKTGELPEEPGCEFGVPERKTN